MNEAMNKDAVRAYQKGLEDGAAQERRNRRTKSYRCKDCGAIVWAVFGNGKGACCFDFDKERQKLADEEIDIEEQASSKSKQQRKSFTDEVNEKRLKVKKLKASRMAKKEVGL